MLPQVLEVEAILDVVGDQDLDLALVCRQCEAADPGRVAIDFDHGAYRDQGRIRVAVVAAAREDESRTDEERLTHRATERVPPAANHNRNQAGPTARS
jgi:hypothetical protein